MLNAKFITVNYFAFKVKLVIRVVFYASNLAINLMGNLKTQIIKNVILTIIFRRLTSLADYRLLLLS